MASYILVLCLKLNIKISQKNLWTIENVGKN